MWVYAMIPAGALLVCLSRFLNLAFWVLSLILILISVLLVFLFARFPLLGFFFFGESATELSEHRGDQTGAMDPSSHVRIVFACAVGKHVHTHHVRRTARTDSAEAR
jgi:hypothetical protein